MAVGLGGALGALARWAVAEVVPDPGPGFPWATFVTNVSGSLLLGALLVWVLEVAPPGRYLRPFLGVGVLGGFTTFSAYTAETRALLSDGRAGVAMLYLAGTAVAAVAGAWAGAVLARRVAGVAPVRGTRRSR